MRDLSNVFVSVLFCTNEAIRTPRDLMRLWAHETQRVYRDKLACAKDVESFDKAQVDIVRKYFEPKFICSVTQLSANSFITQIHM